VRDAADEEVVAQVHDELVVAEELARDEHAVGEHEGGVLPDVGDLEAEPGPVADVPDRLEPVEEHGLVGHRDQLLGGGGA